MLCIKNTVYSSRVLASLSLSLYPIIISSIFMDDIDDNGVRSCSVRTFVSLSFHEKEKVLQRIQTTYHLNYTNHLLLL